VQVSIAGPIEVETPSGQRFSAVPHPNCITQGIETAIAADFMLLSVPSLQAPALPLGAFADVDEGDEIYLAGYPLAIEQPVVAHGLLSTKWQSPSHLIQGPNRDVAWLDVTMNKGNSGGPVLRIANDEQDDSVIGIASFGLNPFAADIEQITQVAAQFPGHGNIMGVPMGPFFTTVGRALSSNSLGVSGCVAIDYAKRSIP
jgi:S1-C subfamily serine protease